MSTNYIKSWYLLAPLTLLVITLITFFAQQQAWKYHLEVDIWGFYFPRFSYFLENNSFASYSANEYLPGAMLFFLVPGFIVFFLELTWQSYVAGLFATNICLIVLHIFILKRISWYAPLIFLIIIFSSGPIILYRHELLVSIFIVTSFYFIKKNKNHLSSVFLGIATATKIYPFFIFPYIFILNIKKGANYLITLTLLFFSGIVGVFAIYLFFGSIDEIKSALLINAIKPLHAESIWATFIELGNKIFTGNWAPGKGANGIFGVDPNYTILPITFYNYFWIIPYVLFNLFLLFSKVKGSIQRFNPRYAFLAILIFIIFSKIITPQYLLWPFLIFPLFTIEKRTLFFDAITIGLITTCLLLTQLIYPLNYTDLLGTFFTSGKREDLFILLAIRNLLLILIFLIVLFSINKQNETHK